MTFNYLDENILTGERLRIYTGPTAYQDRTVEVVLPWGPGNPERPPGHGDHFALDEPVDGAKVFELRVVRREWARVTPQGWDRTTRFHVIRLDRVEREEKVGQLPACELRPGDVVSASFDDHEHERVIESIEKPGQLTDRARVVYADGAESHVPWLVPVLNVVRRGTQEGTK